MLQNVLIIGGSGFVGNAVVRGFQKHKCAVAVLNRGNQKIAGVEQLIADRNEPEALKAAIDGRRFDAVVDTNCYTPAQASLLIEALEGSTKRIAMISSASVYSEELGRPSRETDKLGGAPVWGDYGKQKWLAEEAYAKALTAFDQVAIVRPPYIFGPNNNLDREKWFWARQKAGKPIVLPGDGQTRLQFIHEDDVADAVRFVLSRNDGGFEVFNIADANVVTLDELTSMLADVASAEFRTVHVGERHSDVPARSWFPFRNYPCLADPAKLYNAGWRPAAGLRTRFAETYKAVAENGIALQLTGFEEMLIAAG